MPVHKWDGQRRTKQRGAYMAVTVAIMPAFVVRVFTVDRDDLIEESSQVVNALVEDGQKTVTVPAVNPLFETAFVI